MLALSLSFPVKPHQLLLLHALPDLLKRACWKSVFLAEIYLSLAGSFPPKCLPLKTKAVTI